MSDAKDIKISMTRLEHGSDQNFDFSIPAEADLGEIKQRVEEMWGIPAAEQLLLFWGERLNKPDSYQLFFEPWVQKIIADQGEKGLNMAVFWKSGRRRLRDFLSIEKVEIEEAPNHVFASGATLLHRAVRKCALTIVLELLENKDFDLTNKCDQQGQTALHTATSCRLRDMCEILLTHARFTSIGLKDIWGHTALHLAALWGDHKVVSLILNHPACDIAYIMSEDERGLTAINYAAESGHQSIRALLHQVVTPFPPNDAYSEVSNDMATAELEACKKLEISGGAIEPTAPDSKTGIENVNQEIAKQMQRGDGEALDTPALDEWLKLDCDGNSSNEGSGGDPDLNCSGSHGNLSSRSTSERGSNVVAFIDGL